MADPLFEQFTKLPQHVKAPVTSPEAMQVLDALEDKYAVPLADLVLRLMVRQLRLGDLPAYFQETLKMPGNKATALYQELQNRLLNPVLPYLQGQSTAQTSQQPAPQRGPVLQPLVHPARKPVNAPRTAPPPRPSAQPSPQTPQSAPAVPQASPRVAQPPARIVAARAQPRSQAPQPVLRTPTQPNPAPLLPPKPAPLQSAASQKPVLAIPPVPTAAHFLYAEDEEEVREHKARLQHVAGTSPTATVDDHIDRLLITLALPPRNGLLDKRLRSLLQSRMRDVRTADDLRRMLMRPEKIGGLGYDAATAERIVKATEGVLRTLHAAALATPAGPAVPPQTPPPAPVPPPALQSARPPAVVVPQPEASVPQPTRVLSAPAQPAAHQQPAEWAAPEPTPVLPRAQPALASVQSVIRRYHEDDAYGRRVLRDVKHPQPMSPIDELADVTVEDFRETYGGARAAAAKILEKLSLLAEESYAKRSEGVAAWRRSALYRMYLDLGRESMASGKAVDDITANRQLRQEPTLTAEEFALVADLNRQMTP